jgi:hypothetical protein
MSPVRDLSLSEWFGKKNWVPCRLQSLSTRQFITTVNKILRGEHLIVTYERESETQGSANRSVESRPVLRSGEDT